jgi:hypothetical protein
MKNVILLIGLIFSTIVNGQELTDAQYQTLLGRNILKNASFANGKTGWFLSGGTSSVSSTSVDDSKSLSMVSSAQTLDVLQSVTTNATNLANLQGIVKVYVKSNFSNTLQVCSYVNGANQSCVNVLTDNSWRLYEVPTILGATSSGVRIVASGSGTGTTLIDNAFVGIASSSNVSQVVGEWTSYTQTIKGATSDPTKGTVSVDNARYRVLGNSIEIYYVYVQTAAGGGAAGSGSYYFPLPNNYTLDTTALNASTDAEVATVLGSCEMNNTTNKALNSQALAYSSVGFGIRTAGSAGYIGSATSYGLNAASIRWSCHLIAPVSELRGNVNFVSSANRDYDWTSYTPTLTGFGSPSVSECFHKRKGSDLFIQCRFTSGTTTATEARLSLPSGLTINSTYIPSITSKGVYFRNAVGAAAGSKGSAILAEPGVGYVTFSTADVFSGTNANWKNKVSSASAVFASGDEFSVQVGPLPISGWTDYGVIVGSFKDYVSTPAGGRVETFALGFGTTATTSCSASPCAYLDQIGNLVTSITRTSAGNYTINFSKTYSKMKCSYPPTSSGATNMSLNNSRMSCENCSSFSFTTVNGSGTATDAHGSMYCQGQL